MHQRYQVKSKTISFNLMSYSCFEKRIPGDCEVDISPPPNMLHNMRRMFVSQVSDGNVLLTKIGILPQISHSLNYKRPFDMGSILKLHQSSDKLLHPALQVFLFLRKAIFSYRPI